MATRVNADYVRKALGKIDTYTRNIGKNVARSLRMGTVRSMGEAGVGLGDAIEDIQEILAEIEVALDNDGYFGPHD